MTREASAPSEPLEVEHDDSARWTVHTEVFDGPLDLLLYLVERDGVDLRRLEVSRITDSYLAYLDRMRVLNLSVAADYLVMAATLVHLKSLDLLPRMPTLTEDGPDPREDLARQLQDYARYREAADQLERRPRLDRDVFVREPLDLDEGERPLVAGVDAFGLLDVYYDLLSRAAEPEPEVSFLGSSGPDFPTCCRRILQALGGLGGRGELGGMLRSLRSRAERVVTFVAALEMVRLGWLDVEQAVHLGPITLTQVAADDAIDLAVISGFVEAT